jgi:hypothetical protein
MRNGDTTAPQWRRFMWETMLPLGDTPDAHTLTVPSSAPETLDLMAMYPGPIAATHKLRCTDGRFYTHFGAMDGFWSRSIDPGCFDYHLWTPTTMYYFGFQDGQGLHWAVPPTLALPRFWNPDVPYRRESVEFYLHRYNIHDVRLESVQTLITAERVIEQGELLYKLYGLMGTVSETWWLSPSIPIQGGGHAPGMRGALFVHEGGGMTGWEFTEWVPK